MSILLKLFLLIATISTVDESSAFSMNFVHDIKDASARNITKSMLNTVKHNLPIVDTLRKVFGEYLVQKQCTSNTRLSTRIDPNHPLSFMNSNSECRAIVNKELQGLGDKLKNKVNMDQISMGIAKRFDKLTKYFNSTMSDNINGASTDYHPDEKLQWSTNGLGNSLSSLLFDEKDGLFSELPTQTSYANAYTRNALMFIFSRGQHEDGLSSLYNLFSLGVASKISTTKHAVSSSMSSMVGGMRNRALSIGSSVGMSYLFNSSTSSPQTQTQGPDLSGADDMDTGDEQVPHAAVIRSVSISNSTAKQFQNVQQLQKESNTVIDLDNLFEETDSESHVAEDDAPESVAASVRQSVHKPLDVANHELFSSHRYSEEDILRTALSRMFSVAEFGDDLSSSVSQGSQQSNPVSRSGSISVASEAGLVRPTRNGQQHGINIHRQSQSQSQQLHQQIQSDQSLSPRFIGLFMAIFTKMFFDRSLDPVEEAWLWWWADDMLEFLIYELSARKFEIKSKMGNIKTVGNAIFYSSSNISSVTGKSDSSESEPHDHVFIAFLKLMREMIRPWRLYAEKLFTGVNTPIKKNLFEIVSESDPSKTISFANNSDYNFSNYTSKMPPNSSNMKNIYEDEFTGNPGILFFPSSKSNAKLVPNENVLNLEEARKRLNSSDQNTMKPASLLQPFTLMIRHYLDKSGKLKEHDFYNVFRIQKKFRSADDIQSLGGYNTDEEYSIRTRSTSPGSTNSPPSRQYSEAAASETLAYSRFSPTPSGYASPYPQSHDGKSMIMSPMHVVKPGLALEIQSTSECPKMKSETFLQFLDDNIKKMMTKVFPKEILDNYLSLSSTTVTSEGAVGVRLNGKDLDADLVIIMDIMEDFTQDIANEVSIIRPNVFAMTKLREFLKKKRNLRASRLSITESNDINSDIENAQIAMIDYLLGSATAKSKLNQNDQTLTFRSYQESLELQSLLGPWLSLSNPMKAIPRHIILHNGSDLIGYHTEIENRKFLSVMYYSYKDVISPVISSKREIVKDGEESNSPQVSSKYVVTDWLWKRAVTKFGL